MGFHDTGCLLSIVYHGTVPIFEVGGHVSGVCGFAVFDRSILVVRVGIDGIGVVAAGGVVVIGVYGRELVVDICRGALVVIGYLCIGCGAVVG